ncbi:ribonuclease III [Neosynechococcus sphagnicola sy1]|uniref:Ribonuclease 3 n=1 Tax=Neosynechococcus sphagnicola sy1 TaxID=1497020 RepID=A0A098TLN3_9CYAN|nr:ribonuclease III [Neosynechococcus sphagnicola]KGF72782.1 ribonuclease III [Neosynechococcus sphagnicola sy1]
MSTILNLPPFRDQSLYQRALTHSSYHNEHPEAGGDNERLEFLGDALLTFLSGEYLYQQFPQHSEGELTQLRAALVDERQLAVFAGALNLGASLRLGKGTDHPQSRTNPNLLSSGFEALMGAYFLDCGSDINPVREYITPFFQYFLADLAAPVPPTNYKGRLQEWAQNHFGQPPQYLLVDELGPDHAKQFVVRVQIADQAYELGQGRKKQEAEKDAARNTLAALGLI